LMERGSKSRSNVATSKRLTSLPARLDHPSCCESQTRAPALMERGSKSRSNVATSRRPTSPPTRLDQPSRCESQTRAPALTARGSKSRSNVAASRRPTSLPTRRAHPSRFESDPGLEDLASWTILASMLLMPTSLCLPAVGRSDPEPGWLIWPPGQCQASPGSVALREQP